MSAPRLIAASATPIDADGTPEAALLTAHARRLLDEGCDAVALFGTTGEGPCFAMSQRTGTLDAVLAAGLAPERLFVSVSGMAVANVVTMARHALARGVRDLLLMPLFFFRDAANEDAVYRYYVEVIERIADERLRLWLYHFPAIAGIGLTMGTIESLAARFPDAVAGIKDSAGDLDFTLELIRRFPGLQVLTGTETHVAEAIAAGGAGTLCGLANIIPQLMRRLIGADAGARRRLTMEVQALDELLSGGPFAAMLKAVIAGQTGEARWRRVMPPLAALEDAAARDLAARFAARLEQAGRAA
jgi:4-hydroxy-tetrahydrodipicolinate synthase